MAMIDSTSVYRLRPGWRLQWEQAQGRHVLLYPEGMVQLNDSAGAILAQLDGRRDVADVVANLQARFADAPAAEIERDVHDFLLDAARQGWIQHD
ncbi:pyrroloquinoline quinone biosynthesis peptide chaperone PqqD [Halomonas sp. MCCC 1A17488]|uniref:PqqA binding protein n=1 Tax=Billgrantia sulfidoxydans TaxID=2733484 RepID=A0ABX7WAF0_9GAMM|nr:MULTISPECIES: pyrroloquinoline quinone biosynthesis peptide chaperone PqqD [Halomonas]MCE8018497.1 pyrroloquinoline quinone biosynthesis peptide chaperone PqqD [Halomonas sp. MCCC 1A17488]MCG3241830.1 pyrroloquinoline quinone biosynthesis peptide chaperone PqqD [Halomonas sp. MCCC 1A17488]QPP49191.1 pyrroloquinoline quinone biosynthesis peptide chaperone PqqD [Halomonas sp. SS10-MC5]QTP56527.1 pyrroloquinoline quinone biosynthesis peptide chaperone PqqD [Halomonas sulfidoxydans]